MALKVPILGELRPHPRISEWLVSEPRGIALFDGKPLTFVLDHLHEPDERDVTKAVACFLQLSGADREAASPYVFLNYQRIAGIMDDDDLGCRIDSPAEVWAHVRPSEILVSRRHRRDRDIYVQITAECDWEREHGLQMIYRKGATLSRVSDQDGHLTYCDARDLPEDQDKIAG